ncbi:MAG: PEP-CTERM sorting domain-containing protein [Chthonomonas sp.]|nr:PEP-CTERM sorting domain-containing protein [Chthonomonas sp.]
MKCFLSLALVASVGLASATSLTLKMVADDFFEAYISTSDAVQGTQFAAQVNTWQAGTVTGTVALTPGMTNYLHIRARDVFGAPSMIVGEASLSDAGFAFGNLTQNLLTNTTDWQVSLSGFGSGYVTPTLIGFNGGGPWGTQSGISLNAARIWSNQTAGEHYFTTAIRVVPEPASLLAFALGGLLVLRRKSK